MLDRFDLESRLHELPNTLEELQAFWTEAEGYGEIPEALKQKLQREFSHKYYLVTGEPYDEGDLTSEEPNPNSFLAGSTQWLVGSDNINAGIE